MHRVLYCAKLGSAQANKQSKALPTNKDLRFIPAPAAWRYSPQSAAPRLLGTG
jgi:hypothetical protein